MEEWALQICRMSCERLSLFRNDVVAAKCEITAKKSI
jgi:hypothetical protein